MKYIDNILNQITMYRLVLYYLCLLFLLALILFITKTLPYDPVYFILSSGFIVGVCYITNKIFARVFEAPTNVESVYISAFILILILTPPTDFTGLIFTGWVSVLTISSKYILAIKRKHLFNPVAVGALIAGSFISGSASWWVGNSSMMAFVLIGGLLVLRKIQRESLVFTFAITAITTISLISLLNGSELVSTLRNIFLHSSLLFFASIMITEPQTTPPTRKLQMMYGAIVGFLFAPQIHLGNIYSTPEMALVIGNLFSYLVSPKEKLVLNLQERIKLSEDTYEFIFKLAHNLKFSPGQYMEWTLSHPNTDSRGNRRYFTLASSPTEKELRLGIKFHENSSSFKKGLLSLSPHTKIVASGLSGNFTLPNDPSQKLVFVAGGIGVTPYRSMIKYLIDLNQKRDIILLYSNKVQSEICYSEIFKEAEKKLGVKNVYALTDLEKVPTSWTGVRGRIDENVLKKEVPDFLERKFYLSGPRSMVTFYEEALSKIGVSKSNIKTDFFPGFV